MAEKIQCYIDKCKMIFVTWYWTAGIVVTFLAIAISSSLSFGYKIANLSRDVKEQREWIQKRATYDSLVYIKLLNIETAVKGKK